MSKALKKMYPSNLLERGKHSYCWEADIAD